MKQKFFMGVLASMALMVGATSCSNYLDVTPKQALDDELLSSPSDADGFVTAAYSLIATLDSWSSVFTPWWTGSLRSDDSYSAGGGTWDAGDNYGYMETFVNMTPDCWGIESPWYSSYQIIGRCNTALQKMANMTEKELPEINSRRGEMIFLRAFTLFRLKILFKYVPYVDENFTGTTSADFETIPNRDKTKPDDQYLWEDILNDFKKAEELLPLNQEDKGRVSKNAATAMVARTLMFMAYKQDDRNQVTSIDKNMLTEALKYIDKLTSQDGGKLDLCNDFGTNFVLESDNLTKESIWELQYSINDGSSRGGKLNFAMGLNHPWKWAGFECCDYHHASYTLANAFKTDENGLPRFDDYNDDCYGDYIKNADGTDDVDKINAGNKEYFDKYTWDPRFSHTMVAPGQPWKYEPKLIFEAKAIRDGEEYGYLKPQKELPNPNCDCLMFDGWQFNSMNVRMIRYDDVLLWKAEILIQLDRQNEALPIINRIRQRAANSESHLVDAAGKPVLNYKIGLYQPGVNCTWTKEFAWKALEWENRLEFATEGRRFFDLLRWGELEPVMNQFFAKEKKYFSWMNVAHFTSGRDEYLPVPQDQMNKAKGNYTQNVGY